MKKTVLAIAMMLMPSIALASPHGVWSGYGAERKAPITANQYVKKQKVHKASVKKARYAKPNLARKAKKSYTSYDVTPVASFRPTVRHNAGAKPSRWCGWYMRTLYGGGPEYNLARNWAKRGTATGPRVGAVVVWKSHVGVITGRSASGQWLVHSGNTGIGKGKARGISTKPRSVAGAIAFRML